jgi:hypothetical protein
MLLRLSIDDIRKASKPAFRPVERVLRCPAPHTHQVVSGAARDRLRRLEA